MGEKKIYVKADFSLRLPADSIEDALSDAREALLDRRVVFDPTSKDKQCICAHDAQISDDSGYISERVLPPLESGEPGHTVVKVEFHMKLPARNLDDAMEKAKKALLERRVTFDPKAKDANLIMAYDGQISDDSGYLVEAISED